MKDFVYVICLLSLAQSFLLGIFFLSQWKSTTKLLLGLILILISVRVIKSILFLYSPDVSLWLINAGFAAQAAIGPLTLVFIQSLKSENNEKLATLFHFLIPAAILIFSPHLSLEAVWYKGGYTVLLYYSVFYLAWSWWVYFKSDFEKNWSILLIILISGFQLSYFTNYILGLTPYEAGPVFYSVIIYVLSFSALKSSNTFIQEKRKKYSNLNIPAGDQLLFKEKILDIMVSRQPYLDPDFSLSKLSALTGIQSHILSYLFSESIKQNFNAFINGYRIKKAKELLGDPSKRHLSIEAIADECGFHTISSFNSAFKKISVLTPSEYKREQTERWEKAK